MAVPNKRGSQRIKFGKITLAGVLLCSGVLAAAPCGTLADEIRLKDGKKLNGVIVGYEDSMFKVKTDFGYVLVEKDKIASIIPSTPAENTEAKPAAKKGPASEPAKTEPEAATAGSPAPAKRGKDFAKGANTKPIAPAVTNAGSKVAAPPSLSVTSVPPTTSVASTVKVPSAPKEPEVPANREDIQGNLYTSYTYGFRMYKAPSWRLLDDARNALPNAVVAMGTSNESTLLVVGREKNKESLDENANAVEKRLRDVYANYRRISQRKTVVGGLPAVEIHYRGMADEHDWSGTLTVVARGNETFTALGMTYADNDLIQIQENVIARAIASMDFTSR